MHCSALFRAHSRKEIRQNMNVSRVIVRNPLITKINFNELGYYLPQEISQALMNSVSMIREGDYEAHFYKTEITKIRGELSINKIVRHAEIIYVKYPEMEAMPIILRVCRPYDLAFDEYLVSDTLINFRRFLFNGASPINSSSLLQLMSHALLTFGDNLTAFNASALGYCNSALVPNYSSSTYTKLLGDILNNNRDNSQVIYPTNNNEVVERIIEAVYGKGINAANLVSIAGILKGDIRSIQGQMYTHTGSNDNTASDQSYTTSEICNSDFYYAVLSLTKFPFDHFMIFVNLKPKWELEVRELDSMAGFNLPMTYDKIIDALSYECASFLTIYCTKIGNGFIDYPVNANGQASMKYYISHNGITREVIAVSFRRTMDEYLDVWFIFDDDSCQGISIDLFMLSVLSPAICM